MLEIIDLGSGPSEEPCAALGVTPQFERLNRFELDVYEAALIAVYGPPPSRTKFRKREHRHDFGIYTHLELRVDDLGGSALAYAKAVGRGLRTWIQAGFTAPVDYFGGENRPEVHFDGKIESAVASTLMSARPNPDGRFPIPAFAEITANLTAAYPTVAASMICLSAMTGEQEND
ncbi:MAG: hypothetical protein WA979_05920 [Pacificimonas sp.]